MTDKFVNLSDAMSDINELVTDMIVGQQHRMEQYSKTTPLEICMIAEVLFFKKALLIAEVALGKTSPKLLEIVASFDAQLETLRTKMEEVPCELSP